MDTDNLRYLHEIARTGRVRAAAASLKVDETTVSRRIGRLERDLGVRVFDRTPSGWRLTDAGRLLLPHAEAVAVSAAGARAAVAASSRVTGITRILAPDGFGAHVLVPGMAPLLRAHPGLEVELLTAGSHEPTTGHDFDVAITLEPPAVHAFEVERLAEYDVRLYASAEYLARRCLPATVDELARGHDLVWYADDALDTRPLRVLGRLTADIRVPVRTVGTAAHHAAARAGLGIVPLPTYLAAADPQLTEVLPGELHVRQTCWLVVPRTLGSVPQVREVAHTIRRIVRSHPHWARP